MILLPDAKDGLQELENNFSKINLHDISKKMTQYHVTVKLPRFKLEHSLQLEDVLSNVSKYHKQYIIILLYIYFNYFLAWMSNNVYTSGKLF